MMYNKEENKKYIELIKNDKESMEYFKNHEVYKEVKEHLGEIVIDDWDNKCKLLVGLDVDMIDFHYIFWDGEKLSGMSAVQSPIYLKNKIDDVDYNNMRSKIIYNSDPYYCLELAYQEYKEHSLFLLKYEEKFETFIDKMIIDFCKKRNLKVPVNKKEFLKLKELYL